MLNEICLIYELLGCIYAHLVLEVGLRDLDNSFHISYLYIENVYILQIRLHQIIVYV